MKSGITGKLPHNEFLIKVALVIILFCCTFITFKALQKPIIYNATLKNVTHTFSRDVVYKHVVWNVNEPYYYMDSKNTCRWDAAIYSDIKEKYYNKNDPAYAFFPLFPLLWKFSNISILFIGLFNYLLFGAAVILISMLFFNTNEISLIERLCVFTVSLLLPPIVIYYMPYAEALFTFTFALAVYGLIKNKYWLFFISIALFAMTRPIFLVVGLSFIIVDILYFIKHKNESHFLKELALKLVPLILGTCIVFFMFYLNSGSFFKYFESVNKYWHTSFRIPEKITDWSIEGYGMTVFTMFFVILPAAILFLKYFIPMIADKTKEQQLPSIFNGNKEFIKTYFFNQSIVYFWGVFLFIIFFQGGELNGVNRYVIASPFFLIFLFYLYPKLKEYKLKPFLIIISLLIISSFIMLISQTELQSAVNFNDSGYFTLLFSFIYLFSLRFLNNRMKVVLLAIIAIYNIIWITYLYDIYLCNGWIFT